MGILAIIILRLFIPLIILKQPFWGGIASVLLDFFDFEAIKFFYPQGFENYQNLDKVLDTYYLSLELYTISFWQNVKARQIGIGLFIYRLIGVVLFELSGIRALLFIFPNLFEVFFLIYWGFKVFKGKEPDLSKNRIKGFIAGIFLYKLILEFSLHIYDINGWLLNHFLSISIQL